MTGVESVALQVAVEGGLIGGLRDDGLAVFRNIPYAAPPFGDLRFSPPERPEEWDGVRDGTASGPAAPQPLAFDIPGNDYFNPTRYGEDCLTLEVWTPDLGADSLPVMVWIHGGGLALGVGSAPAHSGRTFVRDGIVHVSINYRLGVEGYLPMGDGTDNLGLQDQIFALEWVQRNIAAFGGDPGNVTIFGQSGGAVSVLSIMAAPAARGLFARAISQSGTSLASVPLEEGVAMTKRMAKRLGVPPTREGFRSVPVDRTAAETLPFALSFVRNPLRNGSASFMLSPFRVLSGTPSMPDPPLVAARADGGVPLLAGTTRNEAYDFLQLFGEKGLPAPLAWYAEHLMKADRGVKKAYRDGRGITGGVPLLDAVWTDWSFRIPTIRLLEERRAVSHLYEFRWESPRHPAGLGAPHTLELPFMRDELAGLLATGAPGEAIVGPNPPQALATAMHDVWVRFAKTGDPGWNPYSPDSRATMLFDTDSRVVDDAAAPERQAWAGRR